jgi:rare lipoprotein A
LLHLQVAALRKRADASRLADELRGKGYPVVVVAASKSENPRWIRVKVGPYRSTREASRVKARLARDGYDSIVRRQ